MAQFIPDGIREFRPQHLDDGSGTTCPLAEATFEIGALGMTQQKTTGKEVARPCGVDNLRNRHRWYFRTPSSFNGASPLGTEFHHHRRAMLGQCFKCLSRRKPGHGSCLFFIGKDDVGLFQQVHEEFTISLNNVPRSQIKTHLCSGLSGQIHCGVNQFVILHQITFDEEIAGLGKPLFAQFCRVHRSRCPKISGKRAMSVGHHKRSGHARREFVVIERDGLHTLRSSFTGVKLSIAVATSLSNESGRTSQAGHRQQGIAGRPTRTSLYLKAFKALHDMVVGRCVNQCHPVLGKTQFLNN